LKTAPTRDQLVVLVTKGACSIEALSEGRWIGACYRVGHLGTTAPNEEVTLRWGGSVRHETLQLHLPADTLDAVADQLLRGGHEPRDLPSRLSAHDTTVERTLLMLAQAVRSGAPDLYADTAAHFLATHLLTVSSTGDRAGPEASNEAALRQVDDYMRAHLASDMSLSDLAAVAGYSRFQLLRLSSRFWGETPVRRLSRLRIERAQHLLAGTRLTVSQVAFESGFGTPAHFATAFRKHVGMTPSEFRRR
jgi:AraC family transcriptional regulator